MGIEIICQSLSKSMHIRYPKTYLIGRCTSKYTSSDEIVLLKAKQWLAIATPSIVTDNIQFMRFSSSVIDYLHDRATTASEKYTVAYFYFDYKQQEEQGPTAVLSSLVTQLASHVLPLPKEIEDIYQRKLNANKRLNLEELYSVLTLLFGLFDRVFLYSTP